MGPALKPLAPRLADAVEKFRELVSDLREAHVVTREQGLGADPVREHLDALFGGRVGPKPSTDGREARVKTGLHRMNDLVPPGNDAKNDTDDQKVGDYLMGRNSWTTPRPLPPSTSTYCSSPRMLRMTGSRSGSVNRPVPCQRSWRSSKDEQAPITTRSRWRDFCNSLTSTWLRGSPTRPSRRPIHSSTQPSTTATPTTSPRPQSGNAHSCIELAADRDGHQRRAD